MNQTPHSENPYSTAGYGFAEKLPQTGLIRKVPIRPIELFQRGFALIKDQYWLFLGMSLVGMLIGSVLPFGIMLGPMMVGLHIALAEKADRGQTEFGKLFKGFDKFGEALIAMLIIMGISTLLILPFAIVFFIGFAVLGASMGSSGNEAAVAGMFGLFAGYTFGIILISMLIYLPFMFVFQLIADQNLSAMEAIKASLRGSMTNFLGMLWYCIVLGIVSFLLTLMCYFPAILFMPISFASLFELYRDVFQRPALTGKPAV